VDVTRITRVQSVPITRPGAPVPAAISSASLTSNRKATILLGGQPVSRRAKFVQDLLALALFACTISPVVEMLFRSDNSIFVSGRDTPSTLIFVLLLVELSFAVARLLAVLRPAVLQRVGIVASSYRLTTQSGSVAGVLPTISPPVPLRI
jgi:hypothetical protein